MRSLPPADAWIIKKGSPEQAGLDDGPRQAVGRVAAVVFGCGQHGIAGVGGVDHGLAGAHGNAEGLFHQRVLAGQKGRHGHLVVR